MLFRSPGPEDASGILQIDTAGLERELQGSVDYLRGILPDIEKAGFKAFDPKTLFGMGPNKEGFLGGLDSFRSALLGDASTAPAATSPAQALGNATAGIQQVAALPRDRKSTRLNSIHTTISRMPSSA